MVLRKCCRMAEMGSRAATSVDDMKAMLSNAESWSSRDHLEASCYERLCPKQVCSKNESAAQRDAP